MLLLGSLLCFPNHFEDVPVLQPTEREELVVVKCSDIKVTLCFSLNTFISDFYILQYFVALGGHFPLGL